jgi:hydroxyacylglutathione hydrolase
MIIETFVQTPFQQNTRIVSCRATGEAICIDPGEESAEVVAYICDNGLELKAICLTHGHLDHIGGTRHVSSNFPDTEVMIHKDEEALYYSLPQQPLLMGFPRTQLAALGLEFEDPPPITRNFVHGEELEIGKLRLETRHCPGHTLGHVVLVEKNNHKVFTGDCLFNGSIGRTDLPGGNFDQLLASIKSQVLSLNDDFAVLCGHGPDTTVGRERVTNPFLTGPYSFDTR